MTDRLEELLALMDDGDEEEREDETAPAGQLPVLPPERSREARDAGAAEAAVRQADREACRFIRYCRSLDKKTGRDS